MFNTPFFINSIVEGVEKFRNNDLHPYTVPAYLFINSLPLSTLREKYQTFETSNDEGVFSKPLDYIFATMKKFGSIHKVPYPWILKIGSVCGCKSLFLNFSTPSTIELIKKGHQKNN